MGDALDDYLATKKPAASGGDALDDYIAGRQPAPKTAAEVSDKPVKFVPPFPVLSQEEQFSRKNWLQKFGDVLRGRSPMQTQAGVDEVLSQNNAGPGTTKYAGMESIKNIKNLGAGMMAGGMAGAATTGALLPAVTSPGAAGFAARVAAGTLGSAAGGAVGAGAESALNEKPWGDVAHDAATGGAVGAIVGPPLSAAGEGIAALAKNAPRRVAESELAGLKEGVQNKTRIQKFEPNEERMRQALGQVPQIREAIKADARVAKPMVDQQLQQVAESRLAPFYEQMAKTGQDRVPVDLVIKQLQAAKAGFHDIAEASQVAVVDDLIDKFTQKAAQQGGMLPAEYVRQAATAYQGQGFANLPMFGPIQLSKQLKQDVGNGLRAAVADHVESLAGNDASGKALRTAFEDANREVSLWYHIKSIVDEKAQRLGGNAAPMADLVAGANKFRHAVTHPWDTAISALAGPIPDALDRSVLAPMARGGLDSVRAGAARPGGFAAAMSEAARESERRNAEAAARLRGTPWR